MSRLKNPTLRNRTEYLCDKANNFEETFQIGCELQDIGRLIKLMAFQIRDLQEKVNNQAKHIIALLDKGGAYPNLYDYATQWNNMSSKKVPYQFVAFVTEQMKAGEQE